MKLATWLFIAALSIASFTAHSWSRTPPAAQPELGVQYQVVPGVDPNLLSLDIYHPATPATDVMIMVHGGGWSDNLPFGNVGDKTNPNMVVTKVPYFADRGWVYVSANYRLSPAVAMPTHPRDVASAVAFIHDRYPDKNIWLMGHSAGAHLVALIATNEDFLQAEGMELSDISGVVVLDTKYFNVGSNSRLPYPNWNPDVWTDNWRLWRYVSPIYNLDRDKGIPPLLIFYSDVELWRRRPANEAMQQSANNLGVEANAIHASGYDHSQIIADFGLTNDAVTEIADRFLDGESVFNLPDSVVR